LHVCVKFFILNHIPSSYWTCNKTSEQCYQLYYYTVIMAATTFRWAKWSPWIVYSHTYWDSKWNNDDL